MKNKEKILVYEWLRLFATIFVVIGHCSFIQFGGVGYNLPQNLSPIYSSSAFKFLRYFSDWVYCFHMPLFFILSGAVLSLKPIPSFDAFCKSKAKRLLVPYFVYGLCFMLPIKYFANFYTKQTIYDAIRLFFINDNGGHLWFLFALFWCMLAFVFIKKFLARLNVNSTALLLLFSLLIQVNYKYLPFDFLELKKGLAYIFYFSLGFAFEPIRKKCEQFSLTKRIILTIFCSILLYFTCYKNFLLSPEATIIVCSFWAFLLALLAEKLFAKLYESRTMQVIFKNLFYVYIFHDPLNYLFLRFSFENDLLCTSFGVCIFYFVRTFGVFFISVLLGEMVKKIKACILPF